MMYFRALFQHLFRGTEENHEIPHDNRPPGRHSNLGPPGQETNVLTTVAG